MNDTTESENGNGWGGYDIWTPADLIRGGDVGSVELHLYLILRTYADPEGQCWPGEKTLASLLRCSDRHVRRRLWTLVSKGWLTIKKRPNSTNVYTLLVGNRPDTQVRSNIPERTKSASGEDKSGRSERTPVSRELLPENSYQKELSSLCPNSENGVPDVSGGTVEDVQRKSKKATRRKPDASPEDHATASWMFQKILALNPEARKPNLPAWANVIRLMREQDSRTDEQIREVFTWANADSFWQGNVLCPEKLREKFGNRSHPGEQ